MKGDGGEISRLRHWDLVESLSNDRGDGDRAGYWRVTDSGMAFALGQSRLPARALTRNNVLLGYEAGKTVNVREALGRDFSYHDLLYGKN